MTKSFDEVVSNFQDPAPEWTVKINGQDLSNKIELLEFVDEINNPLKVTVKLEGLDSSVDIPEDAEIVLGRKGAAFFRGVLKEVNPNMLNTYTFKGTSYAAELEGDSQEIAKNAIGGNQFKGSDVGSVVDTLIGSTSLPNGRTISTNYPDGADTYSVEDFRVKKTQLEDVNRLMGENDLEWYITFDGSDNPVFNVTSQVSFTAEGGGPLDTLTTYGADQNAEKVGQNINRNKGDFDGVVVRGYGDGDDQKTASAGSTGKGSRVLFYTDKTILTESQAQQRADNLADTNTVAWQEIEVEPSNPNKIYSVGDQLKVESEEARLNDTYRVVKTHFKIWPGEDQFESTLNLSNKPQTFINEFKKEKDKTDSQTDYMQGARNVWSEKEAGNATEVEPLVMDFEVPEDVVDVAGNNRVNRVELNYACAPFKEGADPTKVQANNFNPSTKQVATKMQPAGVKMERSNIKQHRHAVASNTSQGANTAQVREIVSAGAQDLEGWTKIASFNVDNPEKDLRHLFEVSVTSISSTVDLHMAVLGDKDTSLTPDFEYSPSSPETGDTVTFEDTTDSNYPPFLWHWKITKSSDGAYEASGFGPSMDHRFEYDDQLSYPVDYDVELTVNSASEEDVLSSDSGANTFTASGDFTGDLRVGDSVRVLRSDGNNGEYTIESFTTDGSGNTVVTVAGGVDFSYSDAESAGKLQHIIPGTNTAVSTLTVSSSAEATSMEVVRGESNISAEDLPESNWYVLNPIDGYHYEMDSGNEVTIDFDNDIEDAGETCVDIEFFLQKVPQSGVSDASEYYAYIDEETCIDVSNGEYVRFDFEFDEYDEYPFEESYDDDGVFEGAPEGRYSFSYRYDDDEGTYVYNVENVFYVVNIDPEIDVTVNPDGDDPSEVEIDVEGYCGSGDWYVDVDENRELEVSSGLGMWDLEEGEANTQVVENTEYYLALEDVDSTDGAYFFVDNEVTEYAGEDETFYELDHGELKVRKFAENFEILERGGAVDGATWTGAVAEYYINDTFRVSGLSDGDHTARIGDVGGVESDDETFTITLNEPPSADFTFTPSSPSVDDTIYFEDLSADPDGDNTIDTWEWDFGDGTTETINSSPADTDHKYSSTGNYTVTLTVTDDKGASDTVQKTVSVGGSVSNLDNPETKNYRAAANVGGAPSAQLTSNLNNPETKTYEAMTNVGAQQTPDGEYIDVTMEVPSRELSDSYEVIATPADASLVSVDIETEFYKDNHTHRTPRQDDFSDSLASVGAGAENKEVEYVRADSDRGEVLLDFSTNSEAVTLDTTLNANDVEVTIANIDSDGNLSNKETISANNGTATTSDPYQDEELYVNINAANNTDEFIVRDQSFDDEYTLAAAPQDRFHSASTTQETEGVQDTDGTTKDIVTDVASGLIAGQEADNVRLFIDDEPDTSTDTEVEITSDFYSNDTDGDGNTDSGTNKDSKLDITDYISNPGWYQLKIKPNKPSYVKGRVFLDHHKDTTNGN